MGKFLDKLRQVFNIFLIMLLIAAISAVFIYFRTDPTNRGTTFCISVGFLGFALILETLLASGIALRSNKGRNIPGNFAMFILGTIYFIAVILISVWNAFYNFSVVKYFLIHILTLAIFLIPMLLMNMAMLKLSNSTTRAQQEGRQNMSLRSMRVKNLISSLKASGININFDALEKLSESIKYSDPTPAGSKYENDLDEAINKLENVAPENILIACELVKNALNLRNEAVLNSK